MSDTKMSAPDERDLVVKIREGKLYPLTDPDEIAFSQQLLDDACPEFVFVDDDVVTMFFENETRRYRLQPGSHNEFGAYQLGKKIQDG